MRVLNRNQKTIYYANPTGVTNAKGTDNFYTGEPVVSYGTATEIRVCVSEARGQSSYEINGIREPYTRMITANPGCPITIESILWVDVASTSPYDYIVKQVSNTLNGVMYVIAKVENV